MNINTKELVKGILKRDIDIEDILKQEFVDPLKNNPTKPNNKFICNVCQNILPNEIIFEIHLKIHSLEVKAN